MNVIDFKVEALFRLNKAGFRESAEKLNEGFLPIDYRGMKQVLTPDQVMELASEIEKAADSVVYGAVALNYEGHYAMAYLIIGKNPEQWHFEHEMYQEKYPYCYIADLEDGNQSSDGYLQLDGDLTRIFQIA